ncbi:hypothetical protein A2Y83_00210 [Candidatus Falkowbacteria bacterium RBG_13_39_14]|uniref:Uncharacterized protein n=1 Tax=Candidatus Falkowbacteria bacterium RBG_13_39_14 TaxID=1797985 RepID=A0A1F5S424_9BACT|nr:MAG: hypothetical protein A2Y83_00210 [Candidatus Falkowbacteria bacterium RBG_13_39_14]
MLSATKLARIVFLHTSGEGCVSSDSPRHTSCLSYGGTKNSSLTKKETLRKGGGMEIFLFEKGEKQRMSSDKGIEPLIKPMTSCEKLFFTLSRTGAKFTFIGWTKLPHDITDEDGKLLLISSENSQKIEKFKNKILQRYGYRPKRWLEIDEIKFWK